MRYFKDKNTGEVYAYDQDQIDGGWAKEGLVAMTDEEVSVHLAPKPPTLAVHTTTITMRQARLYLHQAGLTDQVESLVNDLDEAAKIEWQYASTVEINSPIVQLMCAELELTGEQMQEMFDEAAKL